MGWGGFTVIIMQVSVQMGLNLTGLELSLAINSPIDALKILIMISTKTFLLNLYDILNLG